MKIAAHIAATVLGLLFLMASTVFLFDLVPEQPAPPEGSPPALFMGAFIPTGYMTFVKIFELVGGILVITPRTRNLGLLVLGPIILNILAYHQFVMNGEGLFNPMIILICLSALFLLWVERSRFLALLR
jgi:putative oxidoreductase